MSLEVFFSVACWQTWLRLIMIPLLSFLLLRHKHSKGHEEREVMFPVIEKKNEKVGTMILPRRISRLDKAPIVFVTEIVCIKYIPNPER
jgi:hypothetical protein